LVVVLFARPAGVEGEPVARFAEDFLDVEDLLSTEEVLGAARSDFVVMDFLAKRFSD